ncbi:hypothetical protein ACJDU8_10780 [Clostridium sp. WILCCON 0269]|uniref:Transposase n=1 Tax=Candidatus Clostridium eludens TaxID=3381663 RepID=A0ABW8SJ33_9CLOT
MTEVSNLNEKEKLKVLLQDTGDSSRNTAGTRYGIRSRQRYEPG